MSTSMSRNLLRPVLNARAALARPASTTFGRSLHTTIPRLASEAPTDPLADPKFQNFYEKIRNHQGAVDAMMKVGEVMKSKGLDTSKPPSKMEMVKLSFDKDLRDAATNLVAQLKEAGVELDQATMQELFSKMK